MSQIGFIFDCDGTLLDTMDKWHSLEKVFSEKAGIELTPEKQKEFTTLSMEEVCNILHKEFGYGESTEAILQEMFDYMYGHYCDEVVALPGAVEIVKKLAEMNIPLSVASASPKTHLQSGLKRVGIYDYFDTVLSVQDIGKSKRHPKIFYEAAKVMGTKPECTWGIDDSTYALKTLNKAGFNTIGIYNSDIAGTFEELENTADIAVRSLEDIDVDEIINSTC